MAKTQVEVITSVERRRRWTAAKRGPLVAASLEPGAVMSALAREAGLNPSQLYKWRRQPCTRQGAVSGFARVQIVGEPAASGLPALLPGRSAGIPRRPRRRPRLAARCGGDDRSGGLAGDRLSSPVS